MSGRQPIHKLMTRARKEAAVNGHYLAPFRRPTTASTSAHALCYRCNMGAQVWFVDGKEKQWGGVFTTKCKPRASMVG